MPKIDLGPVGAAIDPDPQNAFIDTAVELDALGYSTIWITGGPLDNLGQLADVVRATKRVRVASGVIALDRFGADEVATLHRELEAAHPGRFVVGIGGAHGPNPMAARTAYLDRLDALGVPRERRVIAALGPRMLDLARDRAAGAFPVLVTPEYTRQARSRLGDDTSLAIDQLVVVETDPERARTTARGPLGSLGDVPAYQASFRRQGFTEDEIAERADRMVDALAAWGDADAVAARVREQLDAGADHVAVLLNTAEPGTEADAWRQLADRLIAG